MDQLQVGVKVLVARKVVLAFPRLMVVPEGVGLDGVVAGPLDPQQAVAPEGARDAAVVERPGDDKCPLAVDKKPFAVKVYEWPGGGRGGKQIVIAARKARREGREGGKAEGEAGEKAAAVH